MTLFANRRSVSVKTSLVLEEVPSERRCIRRSGFDMDSNSSRLHSGTVPHQDPVDSSAISKRNWPEPAMSWAMVLRWLSRLALCRAAKYWMPYICNMRGDKSIETVQFGMGPCFILSFPNMWSFPYSNSSEFRILVLILFRIWMINSLELGKR